MKRGLLVVLSMLMLSLMSCDNSTSPVEVPHPDNWEFIFESVFGVTRVNGVKLGAGAVLPTPLVIPATCPEGRAVTDIRSGAFRNLGLTAVTIPEGITWIGPWAFADNNLTSVTIPNSVTSMDATPFDPGVTLIGWDREWGNRP